jgi:hypothetical protein
MRNVPINCEGDTISGVEDYDLKYSKIAWAISDAALIP